MDYSNKTMVRTAEVIMAPDFALVEDDSATIDVPSADKDEHNRELSSMGFERISDEVVRIATASAASVVRGLT